MTRTPQEVFQHHARALGAGDLDEIVADYADDAFFISPAGSCAERTACGLRSPGCSLMFRTRPGI